MSGLTERDLSVLEHYATTGNRELYWNYLSQLPGSDGYGTLALGVVRNDSLPGRVANQYAQNYASNQGDEGSRYPNANLSESEWEQFGQTLLKRDLELRSAYLSDGNPDLALNMPGKDVMLAHDNAFVEHRLDPNCWTPRVLLQAALDNSGLEKMEQIWKNMLDNEYMGATRVRKTGSDAISEMGWVDGSLYVAKLGRMEATQLLEGRSSTNPNVIGSNSNYAMYFEADRKWANVNTAGGHPSMREETNPARIAELNDARNVRLERQHKATQFHEDDPYRTITRSPMTASLDAAPGERLAPTRLADIGPSHPDYALVQQVREGVTGIDAKQGRVPDETSERLTASVVALARSNGLDRADHVLLSVQTVNSPAGRHVFVVQGELADPAHLRASMPTDLAVKTPVEQSMRQLEVANQERQQALAQTTQQELEGRTRETQAQSMRMG
jgi:hypothetical protein